MRNAIAAVRLGGMTANKGASLFEVPPTTLKDQLSGTCKSKNQSRANTIHILQEEEYELAAVLIESSSISSMGYRKTYNVDVVIL